MAWFCQGEYQKAVDDFTTAIRLKPDLAISYFFRGNIYRHHLGEREKAIADYKEAAAWGVPSAAGSWKRWGSSRRPAASSHESVVSQIPSGNG